MEQVYIILTDSVKPTQTKTLHDRVAHSQSSPKPLKRGASLCSWYTLVMEIAKHIDLQN